jgi:1,4-dihydroxy-2-naphthoyl-CoA synthase
VTDGPVLLSDDSDGVRTLTLNRPHRKNAINPQLWIALRDALNEAGRDRGVRALVITGSGGSFCSGADISVRDDVHPKYKLQRLTDVALALQELPIPTVAKVTGVAVGAGWNLALGCDLVVATERGRRPHTTRRAGQRGPRAGRQFRDRRCPGRLCCLRAAAEPSFTGRWALSGSKDSSKDTENSE